MKLTSNGYDSIVIKEVYNPLTLISKVGEKLSIVMRDSGFELWYQDKESGKYHSYEMKGGVVREMCEINKKLEEIKDELSDKFREYLSKPICESTINEMSTDGVDVLSKLIDTDILINLNKLGSNGNKSDM